MTMNKVKINFRLFKVIKNSIRCRSTASFIEADPSKVTIDQGEIKKFSKLSSKWWDENGEMRILHSMNKLRVQLVRDCLVYSKTGSLEKGNLAKPLQNLKIMDVGCGGGILTEPLARIGAEVTGLDASDELIQVALEHLADDPEISGQVEYVCGSVEDYTRDKQEYFDAVVASEVIEHVQQKEQFLECCTNSLKPGGSIFITTLNKTMLAWVAGVMTAEYVLHLVPQNTHDWEKFVAPHQLGYMLEKYGCHTKLVHGMFYNFICNEWFWTPNTAINYALHAVKKK